MIIGSAGSGKSTLANMLGEATGLPVFHLDQYYWSQGWQRRASDEATTMIAELATKPAWIIEGNNLSSFHSRANRADTLIFLDYPTRICLYRIIKRLVSGYGKTRLDMAPDCPETLNKEFLLFLQWVYNFRKDVKPKLEKLIDELPNSVKIIHLKKSKSVEDLVICINSSDT